MNSDNREKNDILDAGRIKEAMRSASRFDIEVIDTVGSTNSAVKERISVLRDGYVLAADRQTGGRGRLGRGFFSPPGSGAYFSLLMKRENIFDDPAMITAAAAVAACGAVNSVFGVSSGIKWVNDVYIGERKICGILAERVADASSPGGAAVIVGVGINVYPPREGFPCDISDKAGYISQTVIENGRNKLISSFLDTFCSLTDRGDMKEIAGRYREINITPGRRITVISGETSRAASALGIDDNCRLEVRYESGERETLSSGEISIRFQTAG